MANHVREMVETGTLGYRDELIAEIPRSLIELMRLSVGPKKAKKLWDELRIGSVDELKLRLRQTLDRTFTFRPRLVKKPGEKTNPRNWFS